MTQRLRLILLVLPLAACLQAQTPTPAKPLSTTEFTARLNVFDQITAACQAAPTPDHCATSRVDLTLQLQLPSGTRTLSYQWLRTILEEAANPPKPTTKSPKPASKKENDGEDEEEKLQLDQLPSIQDRLAAARHRLAQEREQAQALQSQPLPASTPAAHATLKAILAGSDYHSINPSRSLRERVLEKIQQWLLNFFRAIAEAGRGRHWIGLAAQILFVALLVIALTWFLIRLERQGRISNSTLAPGLGAASARDWQLWLEDANQAAARHAWREAVHYLYWSAISRMESTGLWPADRARTPREYLALLAPAHLQRPALLALTRTFERTWYAGRPATEADYHQAEQQAGYLTQRRKPNPTQETQAEAGQP